MNKKILYGFLPIFLSLVVMFVPIRVAAAPSDYEDVFDWDGVVTFASNKALVNMQAVAINYNTADSNWELVTEASAVYEGTYSNIMRIENIVPASVIDGKLIVYGEIPWGPSGNENVVNGLPYVSFTADSENNITFGAYVRGYDSDSVNFAIEIQFNEYYCTSDFINIPFNATITQGNVYKNVHSTGLTSLQSGFFINMTFSSDWAGDMYMYTNPQDNPTMDGYFAQQNQTIIDQSQTQNNLTNQQNSLIQNQTSQQHQDSQAEINQGIANSQAQINQSIQNTDQITNGYNSGVMGEAEDKFSSGAGDLTDIEDTLTDSSSSYVDNFTTSGFDTSFLQSVGPSLNYVVTWFTNFWNMGGALTSTYGLSFAIFIAFYILRVRG